jgi:hypothetical protein
MAYEPTYRPPGRSYIPDVRQPYYGGDDLFRQSENIRQRATAQGDMMNQELSDFGNEEDWWRQYARGQGYDAYGDIAEGRGGYNEGERGDIMGREGLAGLQMTPEQRNSLFLSDAEQQQMYGDPNKGLGWFDPETLDIINTEANKRVGENVAESGRALNNTYNEDALSLSRGYRDELGNIINAGSGNVRNSLTGGAGRVRGAIDRDRLTIDPNFIRDYRMTDRDVNDMTQQAAQTQANVSRGRADAVQRAAAGSGMSPMALANGLNELTTRGDQQANRAMLDARVAANQMKAGRLKDIEGMRLGAEDNYAGMLSAAEMGLSGREADAEMGLMDRGYGAATDYEKQRLASEQDKQARQYQIQANIADRGYDAVNRVNSNNMDNARYRGETGAALYNRADDTAAARAAAIAGNRQSAERYGQESAYDRAKYQNQATSDRAKAAADARLATEKERRQYLAGQQELANTNVNTAYGNRIKNYGQATGDAQAALNSRMQYQLGRDANGFGANFKKSLGQSLGRTIGSPFQSMNDYNRAAGGG